MGPNAVEIAGRPAIIDTEVATVRPAQIRERVAEGRDARLSLRIALGHPHQHADAPHAVARLRAGDERPKTRTRRSAAEQRYEVAPSHSVIFTIAQGSERSSDDLGHRNHDTSFRRWEGAIKGWAPSRGDGKTVPATALRVLGADLNCSESGPAEPVSWV